MHSIVLAKDIDGTRGFNSDSGLLKVFLSPDLKPETGSTSPLVCLLCSIHRLNLSFVVAPRELLHMASKYSESPTI